MALQAIQAICQLLAALGAALAALSVGLYCMRTRDVVQPIFHLWMPRKLFAGMEYWLNRTGFWLALAALLVFYSIAAGIRFLDW
jgi:hypothetical protein